MSGDGKTYHYFVSYVSSAPDGRHAYGCMEVRRCCPIREISDLAEIADWVEATQDVLPDSVVVLFYRLLRVER